jgi:hypothetical protein
MEFHEVVHLFPPMSEDEKKALIRDIQANGVRQPIYVWNNQVVDGRNRMLAINHLESQDIDVEFEVVDLEDCTEAEMLSTIVSLNMNRRQLTSSQKAAIGTELGAYRNKLQEEVGQALDGKRMIDIVAAELGTNRQYMYEAETLFNENPELFQKVKRGELNMHKAKQIHKGEVPQKQKESVEPDEITDGLGNTVEPAWESTFAKRQYFKLMLALLREAKQYAEELESTEDGTAYFDRDTFTSAWNTIERQVKHGMPHALCPYCIGKTGKLDDNCDSCKGVGYVNDRIYNFTPKHMQDS